VLTITAWLGWGYDLAQVPKEQQEYFNAETRKLFMASAFIIAPIALLAWVHLLRHENQPSSEQCLAWFKDYPSPLLQQHMLAACKQSVLGKRTQFPYLMKHD
jgi:putative membrane protein